MRIRWLRAPLPVAQYPKEATLKDEIGSVAGSIWTALNAKGELPLTQLKKETGSKSPVFEWAIGWLAREDNIVVTREKRSFRVRLK